MTAADYHCFGCRRCECGTSVCLDDEPGARCDSCGGVTCDRCPTHVCELP